MQTQFSKRLISLVCGAFYDLFPIHVLNAAESVVRDSSPMANLPAIGFPTSDDIPHLLNNIRINKVGLFHSAEDCQTSKVNVGVFTRIASRSVHLDVP